MSFLKYTDLPFSIQSEMLYEQSKHSKQDPYVFVENITAGVAAKGFQWETSRKGMSFWLKALSKDRIEGELWCYVYDKYKDDYEKWYNQAKTIKDSNIDKWDLFEIYVVHIKDTYLSLGFPEYQEFLGLPDTYYDSDKDLLFIPTRQL